MAYAFNEDRSKVDVYTADQIDEMNPIHTFDTVADMQAAELEAGDICHTLGFHVAGDGGAAFYKITVTGTANGMDVIACGNLLANLVITKNYVTPEMFGAYGDGIHDDTDNVQAAIETKKTVDLNGNSFYCTDDIDLTYHGAICGGTLKFADGARLIVRNYTSVRNITIELDTVETDGVVLISNAYTLNDDSNLKNVFDSVWFNVTDSPNVVLFKIVSYNSSTSPTGRVGTNGLFGFTVSNVHVNNARIKRFVHIESNGGSVTSGQFSNCWCGLPTICIETVSNAVSLSFMSNISFTNVICQYVSGVSYFAYLAQGQYYFDNSFCYDNLNYMIVFKNTNTAVASVFNASKQIEDLAAREDGQGNLENAALQIKEYTSALSTDQLAPPVVASNKAVSNTLFKANATTGYIQPHTLGSSVASAPGNTALIGHRFVVGSTFTNNYIDRRIGISSQGHAVFGKVDSAGQATVYPIFSSESGAYGTTAQRPSNPSHGAQFFDTDLKKPIWFYNNHWYTADGVDVTS